MSRGFRLGAVLRARKAQEDVAKAAVVSARSEAEVAATRVRARQADLDGRQPPDRTSATAFVATMRARQALAAEFFLAVGAAKLAEGQVDECVADLVDAAVQRRTLEKLAERHAVTRRRTADAAEQKAVDDLTTASANLRRGTTEEPPR